MRRTYILLALLLVTPLASAQVYKWTDAKGVVHYSDVPPPQGVKYKNMHMSLTGGAAPAAATSASPAAAASSPTDAGAAPASARTVADNPENRARLCAQLRQNYTLLKGSQPLTRDNAKGQKQLVSEKQRTQDMVNTQQQLQQYCGG